MSEGPEGKRTYKNYNSDEVQIDIRRRMRITWTKRRQKFIEKWKRLGRPDIVDRYERLFDWQDRNFAKDQVFEYVCTVCNRPFTVPRKRKANWIVRCRPCLQFTQRKKNRDTYRDNRRPKKTRATLAKQAVVKQAAPPVQAPGREAVVVWQETYAEEEN